MSDTPAATLRISEIFYSLQGEANTSGAPTVFIRLTGCPLRCNYCDSEYAFYGGERYLLSEVLERVDRYAVTHVCVTGGEPLAQPGCLELLRALCDREFDVSLETSGALPIEPVDRRVSVVMDLKTPGSGEVGRNRYENLERLGMKDQIKFVVTDRADYEWVRFKLEEHQLARRVGSVWLSPAYQQLAARDLAEWMLQDRLRVRLQVQLHKLLWGDVPGV